MLFDEPGQAITYLESRGLDVALAAVLTFVGRVTEAGNIHLQEGRTLLAAETFLLDDSPEAQVKELCKCMEQFRPQIESNAWVQRVLASLN